MIAEYQMTVSEIVSHVRNILKFETKDKAEFCPIVRFREAHLSTIETFIATAGDYYFEGWEYESRRSILASGKCNGRDDILVFKRVE